MTRLANHLVIFARAPQRGAVKRRLAADIGAGPALAFYRATLSHIVRHLAADRRWRTWLAVTPDAAAGGTMAGLVDNAVTSVSPVSKIAQGTGNLGVRMRRPLSQPGLKGALPPGPVVVVGSDIPDIAPAHIARAFGALGSHDIVFGPAADGGYWLVGARRRPALPAGLFEHVRWSTPYALADTRAGLPSGCRVALVETLDDVDDGVAYARWRARRRRAAAS
ncbi:MAG: TIGR04282 family arsenosugar biosynthesis glycosyltransferase [Alphaproteobacteria bacterium]|jgi:rSAM/selenodomain-associated transferase 1